MAKQVVKKQAPTDNTIYKAMVAMGIFAVGIFLLQFIGKNYPQLDKSLEWEAAFKWIAIIAVIPTVLSAVLLFMKNRVLKIWGVALTATFGVVALASFVLYYFWFFAIPYLYFFLIAGCALYLIYILYPHDFFLISFVTTAVGGAFYRHGQAGYTGRATIALYALLAVVLVAALALTYKASRNNGTVCFKGKTVRIFMVKNGATPLYLTCAILLACVAAAWILGSVFAYYCVYAAVGGLFIAACYYTIRLS